MKILHFMLSCFYIDGYNYQENALARQNKLDGHDVKIIASTVTFIDNGKPGYVIPSSYINEDGIPVIRLPFKRIISQSVSSKIRAYPKVYYLINEFDPDIIFFHGIAAYELKTISRYKKNHPNVKLYVDNHADNLNSATNAFSKIILHKLFYKNIIRKALPYIDKIFYITYECEKFLKDMYQIPDTLMEFYPLGGEIVFSEKYNSLRSSTRTRLSLDSNNILIVHAGKMDNEKRTIEVINAFSNTTNVNFRLILLGTLLDEIKEEALKLIEADERISYLGWQNPEQMKEYLCAADLYLQPGGQSSTMQNALCCGCAVALYPHESHKHLLSDNAFYVETVNDMINLFNNILVNQMKIDCKKRQAMLVATEWLDYKKLASRLY